MIEYAQLVLQNEGQVQPKIDKPLSSPDMGIWLKGYPQFQEFVARVSENKDDLFGLFIASNFADAQPLVELIGARIAAHCIGKRVEELREYFDVENDFSPEDEKRIIEENNFAAQIFTM